MLVTELVAALITGVLLWYISSVSLWCITINHWCIHKSVSSMLAARKGAVTANCEANRQCRSGYARITFWVIVGVMTA